MKEIFIRNTNFLNSSLFRFENIDTVSIEDLNIEDNVFLEVLEGL